MQKLFSTLLLLTLSFSAFAQMETEEEAKDKYLTNVPITINSEAVNYSGSAYENEEFVLGTVYKSGRIVASNVALRYNALRDEVEVKSSIDAPNSTARVMMRNPDIYVKMLNNVFVYAAPKEGLDRPGYFLVLFEGESADLYKKISKEFVEGMAATTSLTRDIPSSYKEKEAYFLLNKNTNSFQEFPSSRNAKFGLFDDKKKELKTYTKEERLNINKEYALIKLVKYYNTL
ncbi:hypothetical protein KXJ69_11090 [Aureisphaera sp. CAU 1614]|uniref:Plasminogen-binding protein PgbA N-terminal domain-containing protein n=1 Tax=Halomarinibacterium sedimenti TaxID=2857106 RepID=A0A9X1FQH3_9FLAO|nr:hypothetical protein [Halomarinibacterium sedimenti]MBW2938655.1 hypothetical protein [Halomarinibacterium sedimenti]